LISGYRAAAHRFISNGHSRIYYVELGVEPVKTKLGIDTLREEGIEIEAYVGLDKNLAAIAEMRDCLGETFPQLITQFSSTDWFQIRFHELGLLSHIPALITNMGFQETMFEPQQCLPMLRGMLRGDLDILISELQVWDPNNTYSKKAIVEVYESREMMWFSKLVSGDIYSTAGVHIENTVYKAFTFSNDNDPNRLIVFAGSLDTTGKTLYVTLWNFKYTLSTWNYLKSKYLKILDTFSTADGVSICQISTRLEEFHETRTL
jgi:hypothetical protein